MPDQAKIQTTIIRLIESYAVNGVSLGVVDICRLLSEPASQNEVENAIKILLDQRILYVSESGYIVPRSLKLSRKYENVAPSAAKIAKAKIALDSIAKLPFVSGIAVTGSAAFEYMPEDGDIDVLIIVKTHTLYLSRVLAHIIAQLYGRARKRASTKAKDKLCVNVILEEGKLKVPYPKANLFSAREIANMRVYYDSCNCFDELQAANHIWVNKLLPNYQKGDNGKGEKKENLLFSKTESNFLSRLNSVLACFQLWYMKPKVTNELVTKNQVWLHPDTRSRYA